MAIDSRKLEAGYPWRAGRSERRHEESGRNERGPQALRGPCMDLMQQENSAPALSFADSTGRAALGAGPRGVNTAGRKRTRSGGLRGSRPVAVFPAISAGGAGLTLRQPFDPYMVNATTTERLMNAHVG